MTFARYLPLILLLLSGCASAPTEMTYFPEDSGETITRVWPAPPEIARLSYAGQLLGEANFSRSKSVKEGAGRRLFRWIAGLGESRSEVQTLVRPQSGIVDARGRVLVTDVGRPAVVVFDEANATLSFWDQARRGVAFSSPIGIAAGAAGEYLVTDADLGFVVVLTSDGVPRTIFGQAELQRPTGIARDLQSGNVYVADSAAHNVRVFNSSGHLLRTIGQRGTELGQFNGPTHIGIFKGKLYVTDTLNARVQVLDLDGKPMLDIGQRGLYVGNLVRPKGVTFDQDGNVYVIESYFDHLLIFDEVGRLLLPIGGTGSTLGQFFLPAGVWSDANNRIFVADMFNGRVIVLQYLGIDG